MSQTIQLRGGTASQWTSANPVLAQREMGIETDTKLYKIGDGATAWNALTYIQLAPLLGVTQLDGQTSEPAAPPAGDLYLYAKSVGGRMLPKVKGPSGLDSTLQPALFGNGTYLVTPGTTTAMNVQGGPAPTVVGTMTHPNLTTTSIRQQMSRAQILSAATANSAAEVRVAFARVCRGDSAGVGGFFARFRFSIVSTVANQRTLVGLTSSTAAIAVTQDPVLLTQIIGLGNASTDTNLQMLSNDAAGSAVKVDLGSSFPAQGVDDVYELTLFAAPNSSSIGYKVERFATPAVAEGMLSTDLPTSTTFLAPHAYMNNGGTAAAVQLDLARLYIETDY